MANPRITNGLDLNQVGMDQSSLQYASISLAYAEINEMTIQEVINLFNGLKASIVQNMKAIYGQTNISDNELVNIAISCLSTFIFVNGIHENLKASLVIIPPQTAVPNQNTLGFTNVQMAFLTSVCNIGMTWAQLKQITSFKIGNKALYLRICVAVINTLHNSSPNNPKNLLLRQAEKFDLVKELEEIPSNYRHFGSYYHDAMTPAIRLKIKAFQLAVIRASKGEEKKK